MKANNTNNKQNVELTPVAIRKVLNSFTPEKAISEYVWNGFDAKATEVHITYSTVNELGLIGEIVVEDNGVGIPYLDLGKAFKKFHESQKLSNISCGDFTKGKNGYGRFTFFRFATQACWYTIYEAEANRYEYRIDILNETLNDYKSSEPIHTESICGTKVVFAGIQNEISPEFFEKKLIPYLKSAFAWFLELNNEYSIYINGVKLEYADVISDSCNFDEEINNYRFACRYIQWGRKLEDHFSHFYFMNIDNDVKKICTTLLNKKGDGFWHSIIVKSDFFDKVANDYELDGNVDKRHGKLFSNTVDQNTYKQLTNTLNDFLKQKRKPFLRECSQLIIDKFEEEKVIPDFGDEEWEIVRKDNFVNLVKGIYEAEPSIFQNLNKPQKRILLEVLNLIMTNRERDDLFKILESIVELDSDDRREFARILETTRLEYIISTINLIKERLIALEGVKRLVFDHTLKANEKNHLQRFIEEHYWIFGEEYRLVCSEDVKFEKALGEYLYILRGNKDKVVIDHVDKNREVDLFLAGKDFRNGMPHNIVVEIKNPTTIKKLTSDEVTQIKKYVDVILKQDMFNSNNEYWDFYLIGQDYDDIIKEDIRNEQGLIREKDNHRIYVRKWSDIILDVEKRMRYLLEKLKIERSSLSTGQSPNDILQETKSI